MGQSQIIKDGPVNQSYGMKCHFMLINMAVKPTNQPNKQPNQTGSDADESGEK